MNSPRRGTVLENNSTYQVVQDHLTDTPFFLAGAQRALDARVGDTAIMTYLTTRSSGLWYATLENKNG